MTVSSAPSGELGDESERRAHAQSWQCFAVTCERADSLCARTSTMRILMMADYYLPGYLAGGPIKTLSAMVAALGDPFEFWVVTRDRDAFAPAPYPNVSEGTWAEVGRAHVRYLSPKHLGVRSLRQVCKAVEPDLIYLNSFFSSAFSVPTLGLRRARAIPRTPLLLAPRGEFAPGALALKTSKKLAYLRVARTLGLVDEITWHASSSYERDDIRTWFGDRARVEIAPNLAPITSTLDLPRTSKTSGKLNLACVARVARNKNLVFALDVLRGLRGDVELDIVGPPEDALYQAECERMAQTLPRNIVVRFHGGLAASEIPAILRRNHVFLLPTLGENFGHSIFEALQAGCPVVISDRTSWRNLESSGVGWDLPLSEPARFTAVLQRCLEMDQTELDTFSASAVAHAAARACDPGILEQNRSMFLAAAASGS